MVEIMVPISVGELLDKITILELKSARLPENANIIDELRRLEGIAREANVLDDVAYAELRDMNRKLWDLVAAVRRPMGDRQLLAALKAIQALNDRRAEIKATVDAACGSWMREVKVYG